MKVFTILLLLCVANVLYAQNASATFDYTSIKQSEWVISNPDSVSLVMETYDSANAVLLRKTNDHPAASRCYVAYPRDLLFKDGIIEADIASPYGGGYIGLAFRIKDGHHFETVYFRTASSYKPEAMQYMPQIGEVFNYWRYSDHIYQAKAKLPFKKWFHVKLVVKGTQLNVFVNDEQVFAYNDLNKDIDRGSVGFWLGTNLVGAYKNLHIQEF